MLWMFVVFVAAAEAANLHAGMHFCKISDPDFKSCVTKAAEEAIQILKKGNKELGVANLNPLFIDSITIPGNGGKVDLSQEYKNVNVYGATDVRFSDFQVDFEGDNCKMFMETINPHVSLIGDYKFKGKLLLFNINGFGKANITLVDTKTNHEVICEKVTKPDGAVYIHVLEFKEKMMPKQVFYDLENLVDGNKELSAQILQVVNDSAMEIFFEISADYERTFGIIYTGLSNGVFGSIPLDVIFPK